MLSILLSIVISQGIIIKRKDDEVITPNKYCIPANSITTENIIDFIMSFLFLSIFIKVTIGYAIRIHSIIKIKIVFNMIFLPLSSFLIN